MALFTKFRTAEPAQEIQTPYVAEIERLLVDITPDAPSGEINLRLDPAFADLEIKIKGTPERELGGKIVQEAVPPNWRQVQSAAFTLLSRAHDLRVAMFLMRALVHTHGLSGLYTGLELLLGFIEGYWDTLYPRLDPADNNDPTERINILWELSEGPDIMEPLRQAALFSPPPPMAPITLRDLQIATGKIGVKEEEKNSVPGLQVIEAAVKDCQKKDLEASRQATRQSMIDLQHLESLLADKVGSDQAPDFKKLKTVLEEIAAFFDKHIPDRPPTKKTGNHPPLPVENFGRTDSAAADLRQGNRSMQTINSRKDVVRVLDQICSYYDQNEPASPVPLLLKRARQLVEKNFVEIVQDLAPEAAGQLKTLFGGFPEEK